MTRAHWNGVVLIACAVAWWLGVQVSRAFRRRQELRARQGRTG